MEIEENKENKKNRNYVKKDKVFHSINVANRLARFKPKLPDESNDPNNRTYYLLKYLADHPFAEFANLGEIARALKEEYKFEATPSEGTISKSIRDLYGDLLFSDGAYYFAKLNGYYKLRKRFGSEDPAFNELFTMEEPFNKPSVHSIGENTFVFSVKQNRQADVKAKFLTALGATCFGAFLHDDYLIIMLDAKNPQAGIARSLLSKFFENRESHLEYLKYLEEKKRKQREKDKKIKELQKKNPHYSPKSSRYIP